MLSQEVRMLLCKILGLVVGNMDVLHVSVTLLAKTSHFGELFAISPVKLVADIILHSL